MDRILKQLSASLNAAETIEQLVRPMLDMLGTITGMETSYLTSVDLELQQQNIRFARNSGELLIAEGLSVPWSDSLCKRALESGILVCDSVPERWGDSQTAAALRLQSYVSAPINSGDGTLMGTLCAVSTRKRTIEAKDGELITVFANIVGNFIEREILVEKLQAANDQLAAYALTDPLTGLPNRRAMYDELERMLELASRNRQPVLVAVIDLDDFKQINDRYGHQGGDELLHAAAQRWLTSLRASDRIGRLGGDEFLFIGPGSNGALLPEQTGRALQQLQQRLSDAIVGSYRIVGQTIHYGGASVGVVAIPPGHVGVEAAIHLADERMYAVKLARKRGGA